MTRQISRQAGDEGKRRREKSSGLERTEAKDRGKETKQKFSKSTSLRPSLAQFEGRRVRASIHPSRRICLSTYLSIYDLLSIQPFFLVRLAEGGV